MMLKSRHRMRLNLMGRAGLTTLLLSPLLIILGSVTGLARSFGTFLLPNIFLCFTFIVLSSLHPLAMYIVAFSVAAASLAYLLYTIIENAHSRPGAPRRRNPLLFSDSLLLGATCLSTSLLATYLPMTTFLLYSNLFRLIISASFMTGYAVSFIRNCYQHALGLEVEAMQKADLEFAFNQSHQEDYLKAYEAYSNSYTKALERFSESFQSRVKSNNETLGYIGGIMQELLFKPVRCKGSTSKTPYEKMHLSNWLDRYENRDPMTKQTFAHPELKRLKRLEKKVHAHHQALIEVSELPDEKIQSMKEPDFIERVYPK